MPDKLLDILNKFSSVSLEDIENAKLMDRTDIKFTMALENIEPLLVQAFDKYNILEIDKKRIFTYRTTYFDTPDFAMYLAHHNNKLNRHKIRQREYLDSYTKYLEVKFKTNKDRTIKDRIKIKDDNPETDYKKEKFIRKKTNYLLSDIEQKIQNRFCRITLVHKQNKERITIDFNVNFTNFKDEISLEHLVIVEVKQEKNSASDFMKLLHSSSILPFGISKYCLGVILFNQNIKYNRFKRNLIILNKINHDYKYPHISS